MNIAVISVGILGGAILLSSCAASDERVNVPPPAQRSAIGGFCTRNVDCSAGLTCDRTAPGGQCERKCTSTADCGSGAVCNDDKKCSPACQREADCRGGFTCSGKGTNKFCAVVNQTEEETALRSFE